MKVSIATGTFNSQKYIGDCVASVYNQDYDDIEHIIVDGASSDGTLDKINSIPNKVKRLVSEKDHGIYDAMNKGLKMASGDILGILNSDDFYNKNTVIKDVVAAFENGKVDIVFGDLFYVNQNNPDKIVRKWTSGPYRKGAFKKGWHPAHPSFFVRKEVYEQYGYFDLDFTLAADFELMLRFLEKHHLKSQYLQIPMVRMRLGGATNKSWNNIAKGNRECIAAFKKNGIKAPFLYPVYRLLPKIKQFF